MKKRGCFWMLLFIINIQSLRSQSLDSTIWQITTKDGNEFYGTILEESNANIKLKTKEFGELNIKIENIKNRQIVIANAISNGKYWPENIYSSRYFWAPSGYGLRKGEGYYQNTWIFFNQVSYGFTDNFSMGIGTVPLFLFGATEETPFWITPKFSIPLQKDKLNAGIGVLYLLISGENVGIAYGNVTLGSRDKNVTAGLGYGFANGKLSKNPTINFSGIIRTGKRSYLISENYFIGTGEDPLLLLMLGGRWTTKGIAIDYGAFRPFQKTVNFSFIAYPWLGIHIPFGQNKKLTADH